MNIQKFCDKLEEKLKKDGINVISFIDMDNPDRACAFLSGSGEYQNDRRHIYLNEISLDSSINPTFEEKYEALKQENGKKNAMKETVADISAQLVKTFYQSVFYDSTPVFVNKSYAQQNDVFFCQISDFLQNGEEVDTTTADVVIAFMHPGTQKLFPASDQSYLTKPGKEPGDLTKDDLEYMKQSFMHPSTYQFYEPEKYGDATFYTREPAQNIINLLNTAQLSKKDIYISLPNSSFAVASEKETCVPDMIRSIQNTSQNSSQNFVLYPASEFVYHFHADELVLEPVEEELEEELDETDDMEME